MLEADARFVDACQGLQDLDDERFCALVPPRHRPKKKGRADKAILHQVGEPEPPPSSL